MLETTLRHLETLVAFDTRNPPRAIDTGGIFAWLSQTLSAAGFGIEITDHGAGSVSLHAVRGRPELLFNVHLDTVPDSPHWTSDPFRLRVDGQRAIGLGACDIKGAAAALVAAAQACEGDAAFLFTSDEEADDARGIAAFLARPMPYRAVLVAEPTGCRAVLAHRGISSMRLRFAGRAGHASGEQGPADSAVHQALTWGRQALDLAESRRHLRFGGLTGLRFNIGRIEGGIKGNVIAPDCQLRVGMRPLPADDIDTLLARLAALAQPPAAEFTETFRGPPLPAGDLATAEERRLAARDLADGLGLPIGNAVDFWTEASLFSRAGHIALVFGPGDIAQAHAAEEWVALEQLQSYGDAVLAIVRAGSRFPDPSLAGRPVAALAADNTRQPAGASMGSQPGTGAGTP